MEMRGCLYRLKKGAIQFFCLCLATIANGQVTLSSYKVKGGHMHIEISKNITPAALDSFIVQFNLAGIGINGFFNNGSSDSLVSQGWVVTKAAGGIVVMTKPFANPADLVDPGDRIIFTGKENIDGYVFGAGSRVLFGANDFKNKQAFAVNGDTVRFFLRGYDKARSVKLAGSFTTWQSAALDMTRTDSGWIVPVLLQPGKHFYKFIVDGNWMTDPDNRKDENDGEGNMNSVYFKPNHTFAFSPSASYKKVYVAGSFNNWKTKDLLMTNVNGTWTLPVYLPFGTHTYRFIADGQWISDPANPQRLPNGANDYNSVISFGNNHLFKINGYGHVSKMFLTGSFNEWRRDELQMTKTDSGWQLPYALGPGNYEFNFIADGKNLQEKNTFLVIEPNYTFRLKGFAGARTVFLSGTFNNWTPDNIAMRKEGDDWVFSLHLFPGKALYKFIVDDKWIIDPANKDWEQNEHGTGNSVLWIGQQPD